MLKNLTLAALCAAAMSLSPVAVAQPAKTAEPLKIGFVYVTPISDAGWTAQHNAGRLELEKNLGSRVKVSVVEKVAEGADAERVIRDLAAQGNQLIFTTSFGYMEPTLKVAREFPNVRFEHATGYKNATNVGNYNARFYEGRYLAGVIAGGMTKTAVAGYVAAYPIPEVLQGINAFTLGMKSVNPKALVKVVWTNSWYDPPKEKEAAATLINQGADVITHHTDSTAAVQEAEARGKWSVGYHSDMSKYAPKGQLTSVQHHWGAYYTALAEKVLNGSYKPSNNLWGGVKEGFIKLGAIGSAVPRDLAAAAQAKERAMAEGKFHPFTGKITDNTGVVKQESGVMSDKALGDMNYYVNGVVGTLPKQ
jgi:basic membrane protein A and related proteins